MIRLLYIGIIIFWGFVDPSKELTMIADAYDKYKAISYDVRYSMYKEKDGCIPDEILEARFFIHQNDFYLKYEERIEVLQIGRINVTLDHTNKVIEVTKVISGQNKPKINLEMFKNFKDIDGAHFSFHKIDENVSMLRLSSDFANTVFEVEYLNDTHLIVKTYSNIDYEASFQLDINHKIIESEISNYRTGFKKLPRKISDFLIKKKNGQYQLTGKYKSYKLIES